MTATALAMPVGCSRPGPVLPRDRRWRRRQIFQMVWPAATESTLNYLVGVVALAMVGRLGPQAVGAVGISTRVLQVFWALAQTLTVGATVFVARAVGRGDAEQARRTMFTALRLTLVGGSVGVLALWWAADPVMRLFGATSDLLTEGVLYLRFAAGSVLVNSILLVAGACLRGAGDARTPMLVALLVNALNALGQLAWVFGRWGWPAWGLAGSAAAMVVAQTVGAGVVLTILYRAQSAHYLRLAMPRELVKESTNPAVSPPDGAAAADLPQPNHSRPDDGGDDRSPRRPRPTSLAWQIVTLGFPAALEMLFWQVGQIVLTVLVVHLGTIALAAHQLGIQAEGLSYMPAAGFALAATTLVGQALGRGERPEAHWIVREIGLWSGGFTLLTALLLMFAPRPIMHLLTNDAAVTAIGVYYLMIMALVEIPQQLTGVLNGALRGMGDTRSPMLIAAAGIWLIRLPLAALLAFGLHWGILGVWGAMAVDLVCRFALAAWRYGRARRRLLTPPQPTSPAPLAVGTWTVDEAASAGLAEPPRPVAAERRRLPRSAGVRTGIPY